MSFLSAHRGSASAEYLILTGVVGLLVLEAVVRFDHSVVDAYARFRGTLQEHRMESQQAGATDPGRGIAPDNAPDTASAGDSAALPHAYRGVPCSAYTAYDASFLPAETTHAAIVPGTWLAHTSLDLDGPASTLTLDDAQRLGDSDSRFLLSFESAQDTISHGTALGVYHLDGRIEIPARTVALDHGPDARDGDEYLISEPHGLAIDIAGFPRHLDARTYTLTEGHAGQSGIGNDDGQLAISDLGCMLDRSLWPAQPSSPDPDTGSECPDGRGNPGNDRCVGHAGEAPDGGDDWGGGSRGKSDGGENGNGPTGGNGNGPGNGNGRGPSHGRGHG